jgi:hypothetical protein
MNHDYAHFLDATEHCAEHCFRAMLVRDLKNQECKIVSCMHFIGTDECILEDVAHGNANNGNTEVEGQNK